MLALLLAAALSQAPVAAERLRTTELSLGLTGVGSAYGFRGGRVGDFTVGPDLRASVLLGGVTLNGNFLHSVPFDAGGVTSATTLTARVGYTGARFQILAGAVLQFAPDAEPMTQVLPSLRAEMKFTDRARFSLSLFESHGLSPVQLVWEQETFFLGYVAPIGITGGFRVATGDSLALDVRALAFRLYNMELAMVTVSGVAGGAR